MINRVIRALIISDFFLFFGLGLLAPIFAVFILENIENRLEVVGIAAAVYWITRVLLVVPLSRFMDKREGYNDEYLFMILGTFVISLVPLLYAFSSEAWHIYVLQAVYGFGSSMAVPAWRILFTSHIDKAIVGFEWSLEDVGIGVATAASAVIGALIADIWGFRALFLIVFAFGTISGFILLTLFLARRDTVVPLLRRGPQAPFKVDTIK